MFYSFGQLVAFYDTNAVSLQDLSFEKLRNKEFD